MPTLATHKQCTGCMACVDICPKSALSCILEADGHIYPQINKDLCVDCGLCEKVCPISSNLAYTASDNVKAFAAWANDKSVRAKSATAGAFAAMAQYVLSKGGVVCGAAIVDDIYVKHITINSIEDLYKLQGSKYTQSNATGIYREAVSQLKDGNTVLFSGTGCQVAGLWGYLGKKQYSGRLITVDLICGGVPSRLLIEKFIENEPFKTKRIINFRTKENGWKPTGFRYNLKVEDTEGNIHEYTNKRNLITFGFACEMTNRYSCYSCQFAGTNRMSDFTIGDYWGIRDYPEQHKDGVSVIIAHSSSAIVFLKECEEYLTIKEADLADVLSHNRRLGRTKDNRYKLPARKHLTWMFSHLNYKMLKRVYALDFSNYSPWVVMKGIRSVLTKIL